MSLRLKTIMHEAGITQQDVASAAGISRPALSGLINHGQLPARYDRGAVEGRITEFLVKRGAANAALWLEKAGSACANTQTPDAPEKQPKKADPEEITDMLLRKTTLTPQAKRHFNLVGDVFADPTNASEVFLSPDIRYVREAMFSVARNHGFLAVVGESGSGKSTLREELLDRIEREGQGITVIEPYVLSSEGDDKRGKPMRSQHVIEAIMACVDPTAPMKSSPEARGRQVHNSLRQSARAGNRHVLIIEEAHALSLTMLKHLKRFMELKDGLRPLLSILLIGQPELLVKLSTQNPEIREVMQRLEIITLPALGTHVDEYLQQRFKRVGLPLEKVFHPDALAALRARLTPSREASALLYPLAVHNTLALAMNRAADLGVPLVTADVVRGV